MTRIKEGYKDTAIGVIPEDWNLTSLEEISDFITKGATPTTYGFEWQDKGIYFFKSDCVKSGKFVYGDYKFISQDAHDSMCRSKVKSGDILLSITGNIGKVCRVPSEIEEANINQHIARIRVLPETVDPEYIFQWLCQDEVEKKYYLIKTGQAYPQISLKQVRETIVPVPVIEEQKSIAEILSSTDAHIEKLDKIIEDYQILKKGMMKMLLTEGIGHTEFKDTEIGRIPMEWEIKALSEVCILKHGYQFRKEDIESEGIPIIKIGQLSENGSLDLSNLTYINKARINEFRDFLIKEGDILMSLTGNIGRVVYIKIIDRPMVQNYRVGNFIPVKGIINKKYLTYSLGSDFIVNQFMMMSNKTAQANFGKQDMDKIKIIIPSSLEEQDKISDMLSEIDNRIALLMNEKNDFIILKSGIMENLLTGKLRVNNLRI